MSFVLVLVILAAGFGFLYQFGGLKYYSKATSYINSLPQDKKDIAWNDFNGENKSSLYSGIFAGAWKNGLWVWGKGGLRYFAVDKYSVYFFDDACTNNTSPDFEVQKEVLSDINIWLKDVHQGYFVSIVATSAGQGGTVGNLREIHAYNWWPFMPESLEVSCVK